MKSAVAIKSRGEDVYLESFVDISRLKTALENLEKSNRLLDQHTAELERSQRMAIRLADEAKAAQQETETAHEELIRRAEELEKSQRVAVEMMSNAETAREAEGLARRQMEEINVQLKEAVEQAHIMAEKADEANMAKSIFLANMSHEIRTPMNSILGFTEILSNKIDDPAQTEFLHSISASGKVLMELINDILDLSKVEAGKLELEYTEVNLLSLLTDVKQIFSHQAEKKKLYFHLDMAPNMPRRLILVETRLRQVLLNLVGNALKFTHEGGISLSAQITPAATRHDAIDLMIDVKDTGIGIPEDQQKIIFEAFQQQKGQRSSEYGGTGLGLAISLRLVKLMNGEIRVESSKEEGSCFRMLLRDVTVVQGAEKSETALEQETKKVEFEPAEILIVDDQPLNQQLLCGLLEDFPFELRTADNADEVFEAVALHMPDLILMDVKMPGMDGYECAKILKNDPVYCTIPIVIVTASAMQYETQTEQPPFIDGILHKPLSGERLVCELERQLFPRATPPAVRPPDPSPSVAPSLMASPTEAPLPASIPADDNHASLLAVLAEVVDPLWQEVTESLNIGKIQHLAEIVLPLTEQYHAHELAAWSEELKAQADRFDLLNIPSTLEQYVTIINNMKERVT